MSEGQSLGLDWERITGCVIEAYLQFWFTEETEVNEQYH